MIYRFVKKTRSRHCGNAYLASHPFTKCRIALPPKLGDVHHYVVRALRLAVLESGFIEIPEERCSFLSVQSLQIYVIAVRKLERGYRSFLQRCRRSHGK